MKDTNKRFSIMIPKIDAIYISDSLFEMMNGQSCDCDSLIIKCGNRYIQLTSEADGEDRQIVFKEVASADKAKYPYEVKLDEARFVFDKLCHSESDAIEGIRFISDGVFLFVFALEHNLVITMSKSDLFGENETDFYEEEATLHIQRAK